MARPKDPNKKKATSVYFDQDVFEWLTKIAEEEERTVSYIVNRLAKEAMERS